MDYRNLLLKARHGKKTTYNKRLIFYQGHSFQETDPLKRFLRGLNVNWTDFINPSPAIDDEIETMWFYLNPKFSWDGSFAGEDSGTSTGDSTQLVAPTAQELADMFNYTFIKQELKEKCQLIKDEEEAGRNPVDHEDISEEDLTMCVNDAYEDRFMEIDVTVKYGGGLKRYVGSHSLPWNINATGTISTGGINTLAIRNTLESDPWFFFANAKLDGDSKSYPFQDYDGGQIDTPNWSNNNVSQYTPVTQVSTTFEGYEEPPGNENDAFSYELGVFALMHGSPFTKVDDVYREEYGTSTTSKYDGEAFSYTYSQKYLFRRASANDQCIQDMVRYYEKRQTFKLNHRPVYIKRGSYKDNLIYSINDTTFKKTLDNLNRYQDPNSSGTFPEITNSLFLNGKLRVEEARRMKRSDFVAMLATCLETDYEAEDASVWEKIVAVIIVVIAVVVFIYSLGTGAPITGAILAQAFGAASLVLSVGAFALSAFGGLSTGDLVKIIGMFAQITGYAAMIAGVFAAIQKAGEIAAKEALLAAGKDASMDAVKTEMLTRSMMDNVGALLEQSVDAAFKPLTEFTTMGVDEIVSSVSDGISFVTEGLSMYQDMEMEELQGDLDKLNEEQEKMDTATLNKHLKNPAEVWLMVEDKVSSYDAISNISVEIQSKIGRDKNFTAWETNLNSV